MSRSGSVSQQSCELVDAPQYAFSEGDCGALSCLQVQLSDKEPATRSFLSPSAILPAHMRDREIQAIEGLLADADRLEQSLEGDRPEKVCLCLGPGHNPKKQQMSQDFSMSP